MYGKGGAVTGFALYRDLAVQQVQDAKHQCQAKAVALGSMGRVPLIEFFKNFLLRVSIHPAAGVRYGHVDAVRIRVLAKNDTAAGRRKFHSVGEQIALHQRHKVFIRFDHRLILQRGFRLEVFLLHDGIKFNHAFTELLAQVIRLRFGNNGLLFQLV